MLSVTSEKSETVITCTTSTDIISILKPQHSTNADDGDVRVTFPEPESINSPLHPSVSAGLTTIDNTQSSQGTKTKSTKAKHIRNFCKHWCDVYKWLVYEDEKKAVFCTTCRQYWNVSPANTALTLTEHTLTKSGFVAFKNALQSFKAHEKSALHFTCVLRAKAVQRGVNISSLLSSQYER